MSHGWSHAVSSLADPDQADGHQPRPSVTIRQRSRLAAVVGLMVGATTPFGWGLMRGAPPDCAAPGGQLRSEAAQPVEGRAQSGGAERLRSPPEAS
jgi:hypothetical protein